jgi:hypothetical protein
VVRLLQDRNKNCPILKTFRGAEKRRKLLSKLRSPRFEPITRKLQRLVMVTPLQLPSVQPLTNVRFILMISPTVACYTNISDYFTGFQNHCADWFGGKSRDLVAEMPD